MTGHVAGGSVTYRNITVVHGWDSLRLAVAQAAWFTINTFDILQTAF
jgi:hypothetical protein